MSSFRVSSSSFKHKYPNSQVSSKFNFWPIPSHYIRQKTWSNQKVIRLFKCQVHENHEGYWSGSVSVWARSHLFFSSGKKVSLSRTFRHLKSVALQLELEYEQTNCNCQLDNMHDFESISIQIFQRCWIFQEGQILNHFWVTYWSLFL